MEENPNYSEHPIKIAAPNGEVLSVWVEWNGEQAFSLVCRESIDTNTHAVIRAIWQALQSSPLPGVIDIIPAFHSVTIVLDVFQLRGKQTQPYSTDYILQQVILRVSHLLVPTTFAGRQIRIPVCYDISLAPDLLTLSAQLSLSPDELISLHYSKQYTVYMLGFLPGFAYMGIVDARIASPRHTRPRSRVPAGSVAIAAQQTGIYPSDSPGGWQLIGRTPLQMFDPTAEMPSFLQPGDEVTFYPISLNEYQQLISA